MKINIILGAGFSIPANFPSGIALNEKFFDKVENRILKHSSSEWYWDDYGQSSTHNGKLNDEYLKLSFLLSELVEQYQIETSNVFDYEEFYDWLNSVCNKDEFWEACCRIVNERLINKYNLEAGSNFLFRETDFNQYWKINEIYNYLIADLLGRAYSREENITEYKKFIDVISSSDKVNIFSLNHDTLVEYLLNKNQIPFSDGFTVEGSCLIGAEGDPLPMFKEEYTEKVNLFKLHGSVDYLRFSECNENGTRLTRTGNYWFFKLNEYRDKHYSKRIEIKSRQVVQNFNPDIILQFLTGKSKLKTIQEHFVYGPIYERFKESFQEVDAVILIGYSYRDNHINRIIKNALINNNFSVININPGMKFPFRKEYSREFVNDLNNLSQLEL